MPSNDEQIGERGLVPPSLTEAKRFITSMRKAGATAVDIGDISVRFDRQECLREHATGDEPSEEEWQRRHRYFEQFGERDVEELDDDLPPVPFRWTKGRDATEGFDPVSEEERAANRAQHDIDHQSHFDTWYATDTTPPDARR